MVCATWWSAAHAAGLPIRKRGKNGPLFRPVRLRNGPPGRTVDSDHGTRWPLDYGRHERRLCNSQTAHRQRDAVARHGGRACCQKLNFADSRSLLLSSLPRYCCGVGVLLSFSTQWAEKANSANKRHYRAILPTLDTRGDADQQQKHSGSHQVAHATLQDLIMQ